MIVYTWLNIRALYPFIFGENHTGLLQGIAFQGGGSNLLAIFVSLFLNAALILYFLRGNKEEN